MNEELNYAAIRRRVEEGLKQEKRRSKWGMFAASLIMFLMFNAIAWGYVLFTGNGGGMSERQVGLMAMLSIGYFVAMLFQLMTILTDGGSMERQLRERVMARELQNEMLRLGEAMEADEPPAKRKRDAAYRLSDDGELLEVIDEEDAQRRNS